MRVPRGSDWGYFTHFSTWILKFQVKLTLLILTISSNTGTSESIQLPSQLFQDLLQTLDLPLVHRVVVKWFPDGGQILAWRWELIDGGEERRLAARLRDWWCCQLLIEKHDQSTTSHCMQICMLYIFIYVCSVTRRHAISNSIILEEFYVQYCADVRPRRRIIRLLWSITSRTKLPLHRFESTQWQGTVNDAALRSDVVKPLVWPHNFITDVSILKQFPHNNALFNSR